MAEPLAGEVLDLAVEAKLVGKRGSWYSLGTESIGQGREAAMRHLEENPELLESLRVELLADAGVIARPEEDEELEGEVNDEAESDAATGEAKAA